MIADNSKKITDSLLVKVEPALRRAAERARQVAFRTRTPLIIYEDGEIKQISASDD